jgi:hypothetical protein
VCATRSIFVRYAEEILGYRNAWNAFVVFNLIRQLSARTGSNALLSQRNSLTLPPMPPRYISSMLGWFAWVFLYARCWSALSLLPNEVQIEG